MGWQNHSYFAFGMLLTDQSTPHMDLILGLRMVYNTQPKIRHICISVHPPEFGPWIGAIVGDKLDGSNPKLPRNWSLGARPIGNGMLRDFANDLPIADVDDAKQRWDAFVQWCFERGVDIRGRGELLIVHDYD